MPDDQESGQETSVEKELPVPQYEKPSDVKPTSTAASESAGLSLDELRAIAREEAIKAAQSVKDKRFNEVERQWGELSQIREALEAAKSTDPHKVYDAIERQYILKRLGQEQVSPQPASQGKDEQDEAYNEAVGLIKAAGLDNDPEVLK